MVKFKTFKVTIRDTVSLHLRMVKEHLGVRSVYCAVGGSMGKTTEDNTINSWYLYYGDDNVQNAFTYDLCIFMKSLFNFHTVIVIHCYHDS